MVSAAWRIRADPGSNPGLTLLAFTPSSSKPSYCTYPTKAVRADFVPLPLAGAATDGPGLVLPRGRGDVG
ncbi:hypothetical protein THAOC_02568 [Thalassiosira oceanica]|uniref:Uncharacterized protein n=1 Tax=Thalassiosira oceanica TaxID=159749 RepID=K0TAI6_THAOC|nr:hypothetical protein THAOC_02568 [Thalassiosira oceanica]|eukprot:EJK75703.1 hypothetical protein THAOC_02568 [Thalassiosira oceanica]